jgi:hypothetical protein
MAEPADYRPTLADLGGLIPARTVEADGTEPLGTFTADTRPTAVEADARIDQALALVAPRLGPTVPDRLAEMAKGIVTLRAAMFVVRPSEGETDDGSYSSIRDEYRDALADFAEALGGASSSSRKVASVSMSYLNPSGS